ncbi:MAG: hypothetical protein EXS14_10695 [Planctomycetes bacterium]|nr:hypothetical protein [Planctomycetota bacterium]
MRSKVKAASWFLVGMVLIGSIGLPGCGGGGGDAGNVTPSFLAMSNTVNFGARTLGVNTLSPLSSLPVNGVPVPPGGAITVNASVFTQGNAGRQDFIELYFNTLLQANSIFSGGGPNGINVYFVTQVGSAVVSTPVPFSLDAAGVIESSNAFPSPGVAPTTLRLYYDADLSLATADFLPSGNYIVSVNSGLKTFENGPFCTGVGSPGCINNLLPQMPFSIGASAAPLVMNTAEASFPANGEVAAPLNGEIVLNFSTAVDFVSLIGAGNVTTLDPFISQPRSLQGVPDCSGGPIPIPLFGAAMGNLYINFVPPTDPTSGQPQPLPANLGFVTYMPEPFLNPTQVRIRFISTTGLIGVTNAGAGQYQNYSSGHASLPVTSQNPALLAGTLLMRPALLPVPGSLPGYSPALGTTDPQAAIVDVVLVSGGSAFAVPPFPLVPANGTTCYTAAGAGVVDRQANPLNMGALNNDFWLRYVYAAGPALARNPQPPDATFVGRQALHGLATVNSASTTTNSTATPNTQVPVTYGSSVTGLLSMGLNPLNNINVLGVPTDIEVGAWVLTQTNPLQGTNIMTNPGRAPVTTAGVPDSQFGTTPTGLVQLVAPQNPPFPPPQQPWGNFLYVVDSDSQSLKVFNGYNFQLISSMSGVGAPGGLGIAPDLSYLYVSNQNQNTVQRIFANPAQPQFHTIAGLITGVGPAPRSVAVMPANEDVFVCNYAGNSFSIIDTATQQVRVTLTASGSIGPSDVCVTGRMLGQGLTNAYTAFILNAFSNDITIYESDSPVVTENTLQGVVKGGVTGMSYPLRGCWNWLSYIGATTGPGCFVANSGGTTVNQLCLNNFTLGPAPNFPGPPGTRTYQNVMTFDGSSNPNIGTAHPSDVTVDNHSGLFNINVAGLSNNKFACDPSGGGGVPSVILVSYPSAGRVASFSYTVGNTLLSSTTVPGCDFLQSYYDQ